MPDFNYLDFQGLPGPGMSSVDIDEIIKEYQDRIDAGEPEPFDSFLPTQPDPRDLPPASVGGPGGPPPENNFFVDGDGNLNVGDGIIRTMGPPMGPQDSNTAAPEPEFVPPPQEPNGFFPGIDFSDFEDFDFSGLPNYKMPAPTMPAPQAQAPAPVYTPPPSQIPMQGMMDDYDFGNPNLRNMRGFDPRR